MKTSGDTLRNTAVISAAAFAAAACLAAQRDSDITENSADSSVKNSVISCISDQLLPADVASG